MTAAPADTPPADTPLAVVVLAAGAGSRMRPERPKPLHRVGGASLLRHVLATARGAGPSRLVVVAGEGFDAVAAETAAHAPDARVVEQSDRLGTGHAERCAAPALDGFSGVVLVLYADTPLLRGETPSDLLGRVADGAAVAVLGFEAANPGGYGRLVRDAA